MRSMTKVEIMNFIRGEVADYRRIMNEYREQFGEDSIEYKCAEARYGAIFMLANDIGVKFL